MLSSLSISQKNFLTIFSQNGLRAEANIEKEGLALSLFSNLGQEGSVLLRTGPSRGQSGSSTSNLLIHVFVNITSDRTFWNRKRPLESIKVV